MRIIAPIAVMCLSTLATAGPSALTASVTVDTSKLGPVIDPDIYGQFAEHKGSLIYDGIWVGTHSRIPNTRGIRNDVVAALKMIHVPVVRWPGGCFADTYHWRDGVGPTQRRVRRVSGAYSGQVDTNQFGTHEFMDFVEQLGAEPYISVNVGSGSIYEAKEWLEYLTASEGSLADMRRENGRPLPWKVKYVGVGNESWGCGGAMRAQHYADQLRNYSIQISHDSLSGQDRYLIASGPLNDDYEWTRELMQNASWTFMHDDEGKFRTQVFRGLSLHYYTFPEGGWVPTGSLSPAVAFSEDKWFYTLRSPSRMDDVLRKHTAIMDEYDPDKRVSLIVDEWGAWYAPETKPPDANRQQNTLRDALLAALTFDSFHRHSDRVKMANISMLANVFQSLVLTDHQKMVLTPTYHVFDLYQPFQGARPYKVSITSPQYVRAEGSLPAIDASAAMGRDGKTYLALVNLDPYRSVDVSTNLSGTAWGRIITGENMDSHNTFEAPNVVRPSSFAGHPDKSGNLTFPLPAKSVAVVSVN